MTHDGRGQNLGHVERRLPGQSRFVTTELPVVIGVVSGDGTKDGPIPGIVGGEGQVPGAKPNVEVFEVAGRSLRGALGIAAAVDPVADLQPVGPCHPRHELPHPTRAFVRCRGWLEATLNHGEIDEISGHLVAIQHGLEEGSKPFHPAQPGGHDGATPGIALEELQVADHLGGPAHGYLGKGQRLGPPRSGGGGLVAWGPNLRAAQLARNVAGAPPTPLERRW